VEVILALIVLSAKMCSTSSKDDLVLALSAYRIEKKIIVEDKAPDLRPLAGVCERRLARGLCGKTTTFRCHRCEASFYCSRACQLAAWQRHQNVCVAAISSFKFKPAFPPNMVKRKQLVDSVHLTIAGEVSICKPALPFMSDSVQDVATDGNFRLSSANLDGLRQTGLNQLEAKPSNHRSRSPSMCGNSDFSQDSIPELIAGGEFGMSYQQMGDPDSWDVATEGLLHTDDFSSINDFGARENRDTSYASSSFQYDVILSDRLQRLWNEEPRSLSELFDTEVLLERRILSHECKVSPSDFRSRSSMGGKDMISCLVNASRRSIEDDCIDIIILPVRRSEWSDFPLFEQEMEVFRLHISGKNMAKLALEITFSYALDGTEAFIAKLRDQCRCIVMPNKSECFFEVITFSHSDIYLRPSTFDLPVSTSSPPFPQLGSNDDDSGENLVLRSSPLKLTFQKGPAPNPYRVDPIDVQTHQPSFTSLSSYTGHDTAMHEKISTLMSFLPQLTREQAEQALIFCHGDVERAAERTLSLEENAWLD